MSGYEDLRGVFPAGSVRSKLTGQGLQQFMVEAILRLFDADKGRGVRVLQQQHVRKHLQRAIGHLLREERVLEPAVVKAKEKSTVVCFLRVDLLDARNFRCDLVQYRLKPALVLALHELDHIPEIVAVHVQIVFADQPWAGCAPRQV